MTTELIWTGADFGLHSPKRIGDVGYDLEVSRDTILLPMALTMVPTGVCVEIPAGFWGLLLARSVANKGGKLIILPGVIDSGYRGELFAAAWNMADKGALLLQGERILQLILMPVVVFPLRHAKELSSSERGTRGFGSTGR